MARAAIDLRAIESRPGCRRIGSRPCDPCRTVRGRGACAPGNAAGCAGCADHARGIGRTGEMPRMELDEAILYRLAFGLAGQLREADEHRFPGRHRSNAAAGGELEAI